MSDPIDDLCARLRDPERAPLARDAADALQRLRNENAELRRIIERGKPVSQREIDLAAQVGKFTDAATHQMERAERAEAERNALRECVREIVEVYDHYRRRGAAPAPVEYADVVRAIDAARAKVTKP